VSAAIRYRLAGDADVPALAELRWRLRTETDGRPADEAEAGFRERCAAFLYGALASENWVCWVAETEGRVAATAFLQRVPKLPRPGRPDEAIGYLTSVYAEPALRNRGVGEGLLRQVRTWAERHPVELIVVWPSARSRSLYRRLGFRDESEIMQLVLRSE